MLLVGVVLYFRVTLGRDTGTCTNGSFTPPALKEGVANESGVLRSGGTMEGEPVNPFRRLGCSNVGKLSDGGTCRL